MGGKCARLQTKQTPVCHVIQRCAQAVMVFILNRYETERLENAIHGFGCGIEDLGHGMDRPGLRLKRNLDKIALPQRLGQTQQAAGRGNGLKFSFGTAAIF